MNNNYYYHPRDSSIPIFNNEDGYTSDSSTSSSNSISSNISSLTNNSSCYSPVTNSIKRLRQDSEDFTDIEDDSSLSSPKKRKPQTKLNTTYFDLFPCALNKISSLKGKFVDRSFDINEYKKAKNPKKFIEPKKLHPIIKDGIKKSCFHRVQKLEFENFNHLGPKFLVFVEDLVKKINKQGFSYQQYINNDPKLSSLNINVNKYDTPNDVENFMNFYFDILEYFTKFDSKITNTNVNHNSNCEPNFIYPPIFCPNTPTFDLSIINNCIDEFNSNYEDNYLSELLCCQIYEFPFEITDPKELDLKEFDTKCF